MGQDFALAQFLKDLDEDPIHDELNTDQHHHGAAQQVQPEARNVPALHAELNTLYESEY